MKAISLRQPWAWLTAMGYKMPEFRSRRDSFRGECYIQASKTVDESAVKWLMSHFPQDYVDSWIQQMGICGDIGRLPRGKIIGKFTIVDCLPFEEAKTKYPEDIWLFVSHGELGEFAFITTSPVLFEPEEQFECKGKVFPLFFEVEHA